MTCDAVPGQNLSSTQQRQELAPMLEMDQHQRDIETQNCLGSSKGELWVPNTSSLSTEIYGYGHKPDGNCNSRKSKVSQGVASGLEESRNPEPCSDATSPTTNAAVRTDVPVRKPTGQFCKTHESGDLEFYEERTLEVADIRAAREGNRLKDHVETPRGRKLKECTDRNRNGYRSCGQGEDVCLFNWKRTAVKSCEPTCTCVSADGEFSDKDTGRLQHMSVAGSYISDISVQEGSVSSAEQTASSRAEAQTSVPPPDCDYGWIVVFSSLMIGFTVGADIVSFGVFLLEFAEFLDKDQLDIGIIGSTDGLAFSLSSKTKLFLIFTCNIITILIERLDAIDFLKIDLFS